MAFQVTGKNLDVGQALRLYVTERIEQTLEKYMMPSLGGHVRLEKERGTFRADCSIVLRSGTSLEVHGEAADAYAAVDLAVERLEKRVRRYKRRLKSHQGGGTAPAETATLFTAGEPADMLLEPDAADGTDAEHGTDAEQDGEATIVAENGSLMQLTVKEAAIELDLADAAFILFRNAADGRVNIVYRRGDGNIGWIDPEGTGNGS